MRYAQRVDILSEFNTNKVKQICLVHITEIGLFNALMRLINKLPQCGSSAYCLRDDCNFEKDEVFSRTKMVGRRMPLRYCKHWIQVQFKLVVLNSTRDVAHIGLELWQMIAARLRVSLILE